MRLYSLVCVRPGRKPRRPVFSQRGSYIPQSGLGAYLVSNFHGSFLLGFGIIHFHFSKFTVHMSLHANTSLNLRFRIDLNSKAKYQNLEGTIIPLIRAMKGFSLSVCSSVNMSSILNFLYISFSLNQYYHLLYNLKNRPIFIGLEPPRDQSIDCHIHWLACPYRCILVTKIRFIGFPLWKRRD